MANRKENIGLHAPPKCMILRISTTCGNFFKYPLQHLQVRTGQWRRIAGDRVPTQMPPSKKIRGQKGHWPPDLSRPGCWLGLATIFVFSSAGFCACACFSGRFCSYFSSMHCFLYLKKNESRWTEPGSDPNETSWASVKQSWTRLNPKLSTNQTLSWAEQASRWFPTPKPSLSHEPKWTESRAAGRAESSGVRSQAPSQSEPSQAPSRT